MKHFYCSFVFICLSTAAFAEPCLQTDKQGKAGDSRYYDYGKCSSSSTGGQAQSLEAIAKQMQMFMPKKDPTDRGYSDSERNEDMRILREYQKQFDERRQRVTIGAWVELYGRDLGRYTFRNAPVADADKDRIRSEIGTAIRDGSLLTTYIATDYDTATNPATWGASDAQVHWQACEVATLLVRAYGFGEFVTPEQMNPAKALAIAQAGNANRCGGTSYWLGRIYELGDTFTPGVNKKIKEFPQDSITEAYDVAILNGVPAAYERIAELYRVGGPPRYRGKSAWYTNATNSDQLFMKAFQFNKCLEFDATNIVCARGLRDAYADPHKNFGDGFTNFNQEKADYYAAYVQKLEALLADVPKT